MGGGDLNMKKSWHPLLMKNQERVWLKEKDALAEKKKLDQLRKEKDEERQLQELQRLQEEQTGKKRVEKLDWMYATPATGGGPSANDLEDYLLGKKRVDKILTGDENEKVGAAHKNFIAVQNANNIRDTAAKVREDPMFAIKQQEQAALQALMSNPLRLQAMKAKAGIKDDKEGKKKDKKKRKHRHHDDDEDHRSRSRYNSRQSRSRSRTPPSDPPHSSRRGEAYSSRRSRSPPPRRDREVRYADSSRNGRDRYALDERDGGRRSLSRSRSRSADSADRRRHAPTMRREPSRERRQRSPPTRSFPRDSNRSQYPGPSRSYHQQSNTPTTTASRADADAERAARLAAMSQDASSMEASRQVRLAQMEAEEKVRVDAEEAKRKKTGKGIKGSFLREQESAVYGVGNGMNLEERLSRNRAGLVRESD
ncbi:RNA-splicing factor [Tulasnella sp. JGI-2019a]|nr:RNA-splicing factor [Tulasnella sp. JGI-2019a]KAG9035497.1 RNA-splicing factor [Tulasnella sp. JGI-2019a]